MKPPMYFTIPANLAVYFYLLKLAQSQNICDFILFHIYYSGDIFQSGDCLQNAETIVMFVS